MFDQLPGAGLISHQRVCVYIRYASLRLATLQPLLADNRPLTSFCYNTRVDHAAAMAKKVDLGLRLRFRLLMRLSP